MLKFNFLLITALSCLFSQTALAQSQSWSEFTPDPQKVQMFLPYLAARHGGPDGLEAWKQNNLIRYHQELWYYTESFAVKRDHLTQGLTLELRSIDVSRFENQRLPDKEVIVVIPGYRDGLVLLPGNSLLHKPDYVK